MKPKKQKEKIVKAWAVVWTEKSYKEYGGKGIIGCDIDITIRKRVPGTMKFKTIPLWADYILFETKKGAMDFAQENVDWEIIKTEIHYKLPKSN